MSTKHNLQYIRRNGISVRVGNTLPCYFSNPPFDVKVKEILENADWFASGIGVRVEIPSLDNKEDYFDFDWLLSKNNHG